MIDAAGAIYVIGGYGGVPNTFYQDVWASTDIGARAGLGQGWGTRGVLKGVLKGKLAGY